MDEEKQRQESSDQIQRDLEQILHQLGFEDACVIQMSGKSEGRSIIRHGGWADEAEELDITRAIDDHAYWDDPKYMRRIWWTRRMQLFTSMIETCDPDLITVTCRYKGQPSLVLGHRSGHLWQPLFVFITPDIGQELTTMEGQRINGYYSDLID